MFLEDFSYFLAFFKKELKLNWTFSYRFSHNMNMNCTAQRYCCTLILYFLTSTYCHWLMTACSWRFWNLGEKLRVVYESFVTSGYSILFVSMAGFQMTEVTLIKITEQAIDTGKRVLKSSRCWTWEEKNNWLICTKRSPFFIP